MVKQPDSFHPVLCTGDSTMSSWLSRNIRHIGMTLSIAVIVYCFLYFIVLHNLIAMNTRTQEYVVRTEYIELKQDAMINDMKKGGIKTKSIDETDKILDVSAPQSK